MQHVHVMMFYPGGVSDGVIFEDMTDRDIFDMAKTAATIEEGNGNGKIKRRKEEHLAEKSKRGNSNNQTKSAN